MKIFVVGVGRSGTSLLQSMLASHEEIAYLPETSFIRRHVAAGRLSGVAGTMRRDAALALLQQDSHFGRVGLSAEAVVERASRHGPPTESSLYLAMLEAFAEHSGKPHVGDKDPRLVEYLDIVFALDENAHVIHMIRDPRDVLLSRKKAAWSKNYSIYKHVFAIRVQSRIAAEQCQRDAGHRQHAVVYEQLLQQPEQVLVGVCEQLGLSFQPGMLAFADKARSLVSQDEMGWKKETLGPLLTDNLNKWEGQLSSWEIALLERLCSHAMRRGGYTPSGAFERLSWPARLQLRGVGVAMALFDPLYRFWRQRGVRRAIARLSSGTPA